MNESMGSIIMRLRKERELTQEQLANALGITFQAVSKWENGVSSPDISTLPLLADLFGVSIDELFGRAPLVPLENPAPAEEPRVDLPSGAVVLPWPDDKQMLHVVLFAGHTLVGGDTKGEYVYSRKNIKFIYEGPALNIWSDFSVSCGDVQGNVIANGNVDCDDVFGHVNAEGSVKCGDVNGSLRAGGSVECGDVNQNVEAADNVSCDDVGGSVTAGDSVNCNDVGGSVSAGDSVNCNDVGGSVTAGMHIDCSGADGSVMAGVTRLPGGEQNPEADETADRQLDDLIDKPVEDALRFRLKMTDAGKDLGQVISDAVQKTIGKYFQNKDTGYPEKEDDPKE